MPLAAARPRWPLPRGGSERGRAAGTGWDSVTLQQRTREGCSATPPLPARKPHAQAPAPSYTCRRGHQRWKEWPRWSPSHPVGPEGSPTGFGGLLREQGHGCCPSPALCPLSPLPHPHVPGDGPAGRGWARSQGVLKGMNIPDFLFFSKLSSEALPEDGVLGGAVGADQCNQWGPRVSHVTARPSRPLLPAHDRRMPVPSGGAPSTPPALSQPPPPRPGLLSRQGHP